jgi:hypothetical protein
MVKNKWNYTSVSPYAFMVLTGATLRNRILLVLVILYVAKCSVGVYIK